MHVKFISIIVSLLKATCRDCGRILIPKNKITKYKEILDQVEKEKPSVILVDFHAEATSEKNALAWFLDGRVTAVVGTHTHIPTADQWILPKGTSLVSDIGMSGALHSVLGVDPTIIIAKQKNPGPIKFEWVEEGPMVFRSILIETDKKGLAKSIKRRDKVIVA